MKLAIQILVIFCFVSCRNNFDRKEVITYFENTDIVGERYFVNQANKKDGEYVNYYRTGRVASNKNYLNDSLHGWVKYFRGDGSVIKLQNYSNGLLEGICTEYFDNGSLREIGSFRSGRKFMSHYTYSEEGLISSYSFYDFKGDLKYNATYGQYGNFIDEKGTLDSYYAYPDIDEMNNPWLFYGDSLRVLVIGPLPPHLKIAVTKYQSNEKDERLASFDLIQYPFVQSEFTVKIESEKFQYWIIAKDYYNGENFKSKHEWETGRIEVRLKNE